MTLRKQVEKLEQDRTDLNLYAADLKDKLNEALDTLRLLSTGGYDGNAPDHWDIASKKQWTAANALVKISKMRTRSKN